MPLQSQHNDTAHYHPRCVCLNLLLLLLLLVCGEASVLKHAVKTSTRSTAATAHKLARSVLSRGTAATASPPVAFVGGSVRPFVRTSSTGFKSFSQRATRLQTQLQKSFSLKAIFSDVITNHPGRQTKQAVASELASSSTATAERLLKVEPPSAPLRVLQDLQLLTVGTIREAWSGFTGGYALAATMGIAKRMVLPGGGQLAAAVAPAVLPYHNLLSTSQQSFQLHSQSLKFGTEWAQMSAVFGASRLLIQTLRRQQDDWNTVAGSALAGMVFASSYSQGKLKLPPIAMARGALLYGGTMFLLHPHLWKQGVHMVQLDHLEELNKIAAVPTSQNHSNNITEDECTAVQVQAPILPWWDGMQ